MLAEILDPDIHRTSFQDDYAVGCLCFGTGMPVTYTPHLHLFLSPSLPLSLPLA